MPLARITRLAFIATPTSDVFDNRKLAGRAFGDVANEGMVRFFTRSRLGRVYGSPREQELYTDKGAEHAAGG